MKIMKMTTLFVFTLCLAAVTALPARSPKIVGGAVTTIQNYPYGAVILMSFSGSNFVHICGGSIINHKSILTAAHCLFVAGPGYYRIRVGSSYAHSGGVVHFVKGFVNHHLYNSRTLDNDIAVLQSTSNFVTNTYVRPGSIASANFNLPDNASVWAIGWGAIAPNGPTSEQLRHVNVWTVNQAVCKARYSELGHTVTENMLCSGWLDVGGRDQCQGDSGSPLLYNQVIVGISSWGQSCALARYPGVNVRVSRYTKWIQSHA